MVDGGGSNDQVAGIAKKPSCDRQFQQNVFSEKCFGSYLANGANILGNTTGYNHWIFAFTGHASHELGHILDLNHTYGSCSGEDGPPDFDPLDLYYIDPITGNNLLCPHGTTFPGSCPYDPSINDPNDPCYNRTTNNMMGALFLTDYFLSPRQFGKVHKATSMTSLSKYVDNCPYSTIPYSFNSDQTLYLDLRIYNDLIVKSGNTLTITCRVEFPDAAKLVIEPGAKLILAPGAVLTSSCNMWQGVRVQGIANQPQGTINNTQQGVLIMQAGSVIENAEEAVFTSDFGGDIYNAAGGIVQADGAIFRNNYRSAAFHVYSFPSISYFKECHFICDAHLKNPAYQNPDGSWQGSKHFVTMWEHSGLTFIDNTFENTIDYEITSNCNSTPYSWGENDRSTGIGAYDANFSLIASNPSNNQRNKFINLTRGIETRVTNNSLQYGFSAEGCDFTNVKYGIFTEHGNADLIKNNDFALLNPDGSGGPENPNSYAVYLHNYRYADVNLNTFNGTLNQNPEEWGIVAQQLSSNSSAIIFRNDFTKLNRALQPQRNNTSLTVQCNEFWDNDLDWHVNPITLGDFANQGVGCFSTAYRPGNLFLDQQQNHILSQAVTQQNGSFAPAWYYYSRFNGANETPQFQNTFNLGASESCLSQPNLPGPCPAGTGARLSNDLHAIRLGYESEINFLENSIELLVDSLDKQQTDSLLALIADTTLSTNSVHSTLYSFSPLSDTVLISFLKRDSISENELKSLFSFNLPGSAMLMDSLYAYKLLNNVDSTSWDSLQKLQAYNPNIETITQSKRNLEFYKSVRRQVIAKTEIALIQENELEELVAFYKDSLGVGYERETFGAYLATNNLTAARVWLQNNISLNNANDSAFVGYHDLYLDLKEDSITWFQLNSTQLGQIHNWAANDSEIKSLALSVLALRGDTVLNELPEFSEPPSAKYARSPWNVSDLEINEENKISIYPNPSNGLFTIRLDAEVENLRVSVYDLTGRNVYEFQWRDQSKAQTLSLQHLSNGVYYVQVRSGNLFIGVKPIVIQP
ncbi:MAG: T9SS type A sorting domain-containing protein [Bacteroidia bacterium]